MPIIKSNCSAPFMDFNLVIICIIHKFQVYFYFAGQPTITFISNDTVSLEGKEIYLVCNATNDPDALHPLQVYWYDSDGMQVESDGKHIRAYNFTDKVTDMAQSVLKFSAIRRSDDGTYTCRAYNDPESHTERKAILNIECKSKNARVYYCLC